MQTGSMQILLSGVRKPKDFYEYLLIAQPSKEVYNSVMEEKQAFYDEFKEKIAIKTKPHITVASFVAKEPMEETVIRYVQRICTQQSTFSVMLNNFSGFPPHTIYVRVQDPQPFRQLARELKAVSEYVKSCSCPPVQLVTTPHISIARSLPHDVYFKALTYYSQKAFHEIFEVDELVLLRRSNQYESCKTINVFHLKPKENNLFN